MQKWKIDIEAMFSTLDFEKAFDNLKSKFIDIKSILHMQLLKTLTPKFHLFHSKNRYYQDIQYFRTFRFYKVHQMASN